MLQLIHFLIVQHSQEVAQLFSAYGYNRPVSVDGLMIFLDQYPNAQRDLAKIINQENGYGISNYEDFWGFFINMFKKKNSKPKKNNQSNGMHRKAQPQTTNSFGYEEYDSYDYAKGKKEQTTYTTAMPGFDVSRNRRSSADIAATRKSVDASKLESDKVAADTTKAVATTNADAAKVAADGTPPEKKTDFKKYIPYAIVALAIIGLGIALWKIFKK